MGSKLGCTKAANEPTDMRNPIRAKGKAAPPAQEK